MTDFNAEQIRYISRKRVAHLATCDKDGVPTVVPVCHVFKDGIIYTPIDKKSKKVAPSKLKRVKNIIRNPNVALVMDEYHDDWDKLSYIIIVGKAKLLDHGEEHSNALKLLCNKYEQYRDMKLDTLGLPVIKIIPERVNSWGNI